MSIDIGHLIVCGTDTDVGKTIVSAWLVQGLDALYWKPIQSGLEEGGDRERVLRLLDLPDERALPERYAFQKPVSPHWAAELEQRQIDPDRLDLPQSKGPVIVETAGGLMVPLTRQWLQLDQLARWNQPILLVARSGLGTINHTLLSLEALHQRNLNVLGVIFNGPIHPDNPNTIKEFGGVSVIAQLPFLSELTRKALFRQWQEQKLTLIFEKLADAWSQSK